MGKYKNGNRKNLKVFFVILLILLFFFFGKALELIRSDDVVKIILIFVTIYVVIVLFFYLLTSPKNFNIQSISLVNHYGAEQLEESIYSLINFNFPNSLNCLNILLGNATHTTQIDNLVITNKAVYCIEAKNYSGLIRGSATNNWMQYLSKKQYSIYNPIKQNEGHINYLVNSINEFSAVPKINLVVFSDHCSLNIDEIKKNDVHVIQRRNIINYISSYETILKPKIEPNSLNMIKSKLESLDIFSEENLKKHIDRIKLRKEVQ